MKLNLTRPICFIDLETTGIEVATDRIVEIAILKAFPDGAIENSIDRVNPGIHIPKGASEVHGIYDEDVKNEPHFKEIAQKIYNFISDSDLAGFNSNKFDIPLLIEEFFRVNVEFDMNDRKLIDVQNIFHKMERRNLVAAYKFYCNKELSNAHSAKADIEATYEVLLAQLEKYNNLKNDIDFLHDFSKQHDFVDLAGRFIFNDKKQEVFNFGKHKGKLVEKVINHEEESYYDWMIRGNFPHNTISILKEIRKRKVNVNI